jgi:hypothetical protein
MSKLYRKKHYRELSLDSPDKESCALKCLHEFPPKDMKPACVAHQCLAISKDAPEIDPNRPVVWIGRGGEIGQCQDPAMLDQGQTISDALQPPILKKIYNLPPVAPGPKFSAWIGEQETSRRNQDPGRFECKACDTCKTTYREFALVFLDDLPRFEAGPEPWRRVDQ